MTDITAFTWSSFSGGYCWYDVPGKGAYLIESPSMMGGSVDYYHPLEDHPGLFLHFLDVERASVLLGADVVAIRKKDERDLLEGLRLFANRFGPLGVPEQEIIQAGNQQVVGEPSSALIREYQLLSRAYRLWQYTSQNTLDQEPSPIWWPDRYSVMYRVNGSDGLLIASSAFRSDIFRQFRFGDVYGPALLQSLIWVNEQLEKLSVSRFVWTPGKLPNLLHCPQTLLGAIWVQFAQAIDQDKRYKRCGQCHDWFEIHQGAGGSNREYCSDACRAAAYRARKAQVAVLRDEGLTKEEIADALGIDLESITAWYDGMVLPDEPRRKRGRPRKDGTT